MRLWVLCFFCSSGFLGAQNNITRIHIDTTLGLLLLNDDETKLVFNPGGVRILNDHVDLNFPGKSIKMNRGENCIGYKLSISDSARDIVVSATYDTCSIPAKLRQREIIFPGWGNWERRENGKLTEYTAYKNMFRFGLSEKWYP